MGKVNLSVQERERFRLLVPNTIGYLLDLDGPRGDIIKRVTNLQLHRGIGDSGRKIRAIVIVLQVFAYTVRNCYFGELSVRTRVRTLLVRLALEDQL